MKKEIITRYFKEFEVNKEGVPLGYFKELVIERKKTKRNYKKSGKYKKFFTEKKRVSLNPTIAEKIANLAVEQSVEVSKQEWNVKSSPVQWTQNNSLRRRHLLFGKKFYFNVNELNYIITRRV